ncbi:sugar isomerase domain-containing protein [Acidisoma cladoniae]|uniref:sugar isomerase domain-containing protein n=1 Tax=Acidisoma cladoniae TaxID=3040935 RepID=UPI002549F5C4|nr:sugar isomerase domain-containing protein [Acidisoma sp. PAMC 29798]
MTASAARAFLDQAAAALSGLFASQTEAFEAAATAITAAIRQDRLIYLFGTGHSHMLAEEGHYRAGGLACVVPILDTALMLHEGAVESTRRERETGLAAGILARYPIGTGDVLLVFSNSGVNAVPVEAVRHGQAAGACVIAVTSEAYARQAAAGRDRIGALADITIDNDTVPGDAGFQAAPDVPPVGPLSTIIGAAILNALLAEAVSRLGAEAPVYVSANMPGAKDRNAALVARYASRNPHL